MNLLWPFFLACGIIGFGLGLILGVQLQRTSVPGAVFFGLGLIIIGLLVLMAGAL